MEEQRIVFLGAGSAAVGVADALVHAMVINSNGLTKAEARKRFYLVDSQVMNLTTGKLIQLELTIVNLGINYHNKRWSASRKA